MTAADLFHRAGMTLFGVQYVARRLRSGEAVSEPNSTNAKPGRDAYRLDHEIQHIAHSCDLLARSPAMPGGLLIDRSLLQIVWRLVAGAVRRHTAD